MKKMLVLWLFLSLSHTQTLHDAPEKNIDSMQVKEVLETLDMILEELPAFVEKYELNSELSWKEWKKKHWLLAPVGALILGAKFYFVLISIFKNSSLNASLFESY